MTDEVNRLCDCPVCGQHVYSQMDPEFDDSVCSLHCEHVMFSGEIGGVEANAFESRSVDLDSNLMVRLVQQTQQRWPSESEASSKLDAHIEKHCSARLATVLELGDDYHKYQEQLLGLDPHYAGSLAVEEWGDSWYIAFSRDPKASSELLEREFRQDIQTLESLLEIMSD